MKKLEIKVNGKRTAERVINNYSKELNKLQISFYKELGATKKIAFQMIKRLNRNGYIIAKTALRVVEITISEIEERINIDYDVIKETEWSDSSIKKIIKSIKKSFKYDEFNYIVINDTEVRVLPYRLADKTMLYSVSLG